MKAMRRLLLIPVVIIVSLIELCVGIVKQVLTWACGLFILIMLVLICFALVQQQWKNLAILAVLLLLGYIAMFVVVTLKVLIEEIRHYFVGKLF